MKKLLLVAMAVASIVSCQKTDVTTPPTEPQEGLIQLSMGGVSSRAGNAGMLTVFEAGDQIGVVAAMLKEGDPSTIEWTAPIHINNKPAAWLSNSTPQPATDPVISTFKWGPAGEGGSLHDQFYPKKDRALSLFAYYPYTSSADSLIYDATTKTPNLLITLKDGKVTSGASTIDGTTPAVPDANIIQADVMWAKGVSKATTPLDSVSRLDPLATLEFKHALAQVNFKVNKAADAADCFFDQIEFLTYKNGKLDITTGDIELTMPTSQTDSAKYVITDNSGAQIDLAGISIITTGKPLMILPTKTEDESKICKIRLRVNVGTELKPDYTWFDVATTGLKPFNQGKLNTITLSLSKTGVTLTAKINPWVDNTPDEDTTLPVE